MNPDFQKAILEVQQKEYDKLYQIAMKRDETIIGFLKQILLTASSLLGLLVTLHKIPLSDSIEKILYSGALGSLALGVLCLSLSLHSQVDNYTRLHKAFLASVRKPFPREPEEIYITSKKRYAYFEKAGYVSLMAAVICLTVYAILSA